MCIRLRLAILTLLILRCLIVLTNLFLKSTIANLEERILIINSPVDSFFMPSDCIWNDETYTNFVYRFFLLLEVQLYALYQSYIDMVDA